jgi:two-component system cell cycle response regulator
VALAAECIEPLTEPVTASFGVAERAATEPGDALLRRIDGALYEAKWAGRNRVIVAKGAAQ